MNHLSILITSPILQAAVGSVLNYKWLGNEIWRFIVAFALLLLALVLAKSARVVLERQSRLIEEKRGVTLPSLLLKSLSKPVSFAFIVMGFSYLGSSFMCFRISSSSEIFPCRARIAIHDAVNCLEVDPIRKTEVEVRGILCSRFAIQ